MDTWLIYLALGIGWLIFSSLRNAQKVSQEDKNNQNPANPQAFNQKQQQADVSSNVNDLTALINQIRQQSMQQAQPPPLPVVEVTASENVHVISRNREAEAMERAAKRKSLEKQGPTDTEALEDIDLKRAQTSHYNESAAAQKYASYQESGKMEQHHFHQFGKPGTLQPRKRAKHPIHAFLKQNGSIRNAFILNEIMKRRDDL